MSPRRVNESSTKHRRISGHFTKFYRGNFTSFEESILQFFFQRINLSVRILDLDGKIHSQDRYLLSDYKLFQFSLNLLWIVNLHWSKYSYKWSRNINDIYLDIIVNEASFSHPMTMIQGIINFESRVWNPPQRAVDRFFQQQPSTRSSFTCHREIRKCIKEGRRIMRQTLEPRDGEVEERVGRFNEGIDPTSIQNRWIRFFGENWTLSLAHKPMVIQFLLGGRGSKAFIRKICQEFIIYTDEASANFSAINILLCNFHPSAEFSKRSSLFDWKSLVGRRWKMYNLIIDEENWDDSAEIKSGRDDVIDRKSNEIGLEICIEINTRCNTRISKFEEFDFEFGGGVSKDSRWKKIEKKEMCHRRWRNNSDELSELLLKSLNQDDEKRTDFISNGEETLLLFWKDLLLRLIFVKRERERERDLRPEWKYANIIRNSEW